MKKKELLELINKSIDEGIHVVDKEGKTLLYNDTMAKLEGLEVEEVMDKNLFEVLPSLEGESTLMKVIETDEPILRNPQIYFNEYGKGINTINSTWPIKSNGEIIGAVEVARDITRIKKMIEEIFSYGANTNNKYEENREFEMFVFDDIIGKSPQILNAKELARMVSQTDSNVFIIGESGTGKEMFAQSIHKYSDRENKPYIVENCAALPATLLESLLFGTTKGAFTGAIDRPGLFQQADGGTLVLDEINSMPLSLQAKFLRAIQEKRFRPVGGEKETKVDVRLIAITNEDPLKLIEEGKLREDLFFRLSVVNLFVPPLRDRGKEEIKLLTDYFIEKISKEMGKKGIRLSEEAKEFIYEYHWPGNVRELANVIEGAINLLGNEQEITLDLFPYYFRKNNQIKQTQDFCKYCNTNIDSIDHYRIIKEEAISLSQYLERIEKDIIKSALQDEDENISRAAKVLKITRQGLQYKINKLRLKS